MNHFNLQKLSFTSLAMTILLLGSLNPVFAGDDDNWNHRKFRWMEELDLTSEQRDKLRELRKAQRGLYKDARKSMKEKQKKLVEALKGDATAEDLAKQFETLQAKQNETDKSRFQNLLAIRKILTPEQRTKFKFKRMIPGTRKEKHKRMKRHHHREHLDEETEKE